MDPILIVSPHLDDAALSCGQMIAGWPGAYVFTIFGGMPSEPRVTIFDVNSGFRDSTEAITARWHEDDRAMQVLGARQLRAPFLDNQYRILEAATGVDLAEVTQAIIDAIGAVGATRLYGPVGLAHPDHEIVGDATIAAARATGVPTWLYEELPMRILEPQLVPLRLGAFARLHFEFEFTGTGASETKIAAIHCYQSQLWALDRNLMLVPERFHRLVERQP